MATSHFQLRDMLAPRCNATTDEYCADASVAKARGGAMKLCAPRPSPSAPRHSSSPRTLPRTFPCTPLLTLLFACPFFAATPPLPFLCLRPLSPPFPPVPLAWRGQRCMLAPTPRSRVSPSRLASRTRSVMAGGHCHSPACLSVELRNEDTGETLCLITPRHGQGDAVYDEKGYLWLPPCQWSEADPRLRAPPVLPLEANLSLVKRANATYYHYGVMGILQMRGAYL